LICGIVYLFLMFKGLIMKKLSLKLLAILLIALLTVAFSEYAFAQKVVDIQVSPSVLNLNQNGQVVTVHTDLPFSSVSATSVTLNGITINHWKSDDQGNFVAKFLISDIKDLPLKIGDYNTLTLKGFTVGGEMFIGSDLVKVIKPR